ncbi:MAG: hypothetical protein IJ589_04225 [Lachnospiraceae bacterium]|nr:hypothetical protein [Lachnospiraceae bacterium]
MKLKSRISQIVSWILFLGVYLNDLRFLLKNGRFLLDSDMASELLLADLLNREHSITGLSKNWYYSTELKVFQTNILYRIGLFLSPHNWLVARTIGMALALLIFAIGVMLIFRAVGLKNFAVFAAAICLLPHGGWYFWQTIFGGYYLPYICFSVYSTALTISAAKKEKKWLPELVLLILLGLASGLNGVKQLMVFYAPYLLAIAFMLLMFIRGNAEKKESILRSAQFRVVIMGFAATIASFLGFIVNSAILSKYYYFTSYNEQKVSGDSMFKMLLDYIWSFGYASGKKVFSLQGVAALLGVLVGIATLVCAIRLFVRFNRLQVLEQYLTVISAFSVGFCVFVFSYVGGEIQYFQPVVPFGLFLILLDLRTEKYVLPFGRKLACGLFCAVVCITSLGTMKNEYNGPYHYYRAKPLMYAISDWLAIQGYNQGIATSFWCANAVTELSDGRIEMWDIKNPEMVTHQWMQETAHDDTRPTGRFFYLCEKTEDPSCVLEAYPELVKIYEDEQFLVYGTK